MEKKNFFAPSTTGRGAMRRAAMLLLVMMLTAATAWATTTSTINVGGTDYTLFTGFTATSGTNVSAAAYNYPKLVDGNLDASSSWHLNNDAQPYYIEFNSDDPIIPKGYIFNTYSANNFKPTAWELKAKADAGGSWTTLSSKSGQSLASGQEFQYACDNSGNNAYKYFRFEVSNNSNNIWLTEIRLYGSIPNVYYTHLTEKAATCTETGIKQDCYQRNDGKYFTDETGTTELQESDVIAPMIPHSGDHHEATDVNIEYWQCSMCGKYFSDEGYTTEITEEQTKIYRTITIDGSISSLVTTDVSQALAGETIALYVSDLIDASTLKVNNGAVELTAMTDFQYTFTMPAADVTVTAEVAQSNADGDNLTGSIRHTVTIADGANITLNNATISGSIVCKGSATITLVGTNSVSGASYTAGIQIGGSGTTLTIRGDGSLTANGGAQSAGIGLSRAWDPANDVIGGDIVIEGGNITANGGGQWGAGIGTGVIYGNGSAKTARIGNITIKGGSVKATGGSEADGIGTGYAYPLCTNAIGTVTIYDGIDKVDASSIKNSGSIVYKHEENDVTASTSDYFTIIENGNRRIIVQKVTPTIADVPDQNYIGSAITPEPTVIAGSLSLTKGTDYVYSYTNNTNVGTAKVRATFQGVYASLGYVEKEFTILPSTVIVNVTGNGTVTYNDKVATNGEVIGVVADKGTDVTLTLAPESGYAVSIEYGYTKSNGMTMNGAKLPINGTTATLTVPNNMKDGTYVNLTVTFVSALAGGADEASAVALTDNTVTNFAGGWYKVDSDITFDHTLNLLGDTHLIIDNGKTMTVNTASNHGIDSEYTLNVSGEGALNITTTEAYKIAVRVGSYVQTGATVTANGYIGIRCKDNFDEFNVTNDFTFSGGQLTATGSGGNGIWADNDITLSCTNATDFIQASSYSSAFGAVKIAEGKMLVDATDGSKYYIGDGNALSSSAISAIAGKTLKPGLLLIDNADNSAQINALGGLQTTAILQGRKLWKDGEWNTLCLPFDVTIAGSPLAGDNVVAKVLNTSSELAGGVLTLNFDNAPATITAGTPFIIKWDNTGVNLTNPVFEGVTTSNTTNNVAFTGGTFKGNYGPLEITDANRNDILLLAAGNKLGYAKTDRTIANGKAMGSCRAYFEIPSNGGGQAQARSFVLNFGNDNTTGIIEVNTNLTDITNKAEGIYDLQGRKVENPKKGLYIVNGRKVLVK